MTEKRVPMTTIQPPPRFDLKFGSSSQERTADDIGPLHITRTYRASGRYAEGESAENVAREGQSMILRINSLLDRVDNLVAMNRDMRQRISKSQKINTELQEIAARLSDYARGVQADDVTLNGAPIGDVELTDKAAPADDIDRAEAEKRVRSKAHAALADVLDREIGKNLCGWPTGFTMTTDLSIDWLDN